MKSKYLNHLINCSNKKRINRIIAYCVSMVLSFSVVFLSLPLNSAGSADNKNKTGMLHKFYSINKIDDLYVAYSENESLNPGYGSAVETNEDEHLPSSWAIEEISQATEYGLIKPELLKYFRSNITREEFCGIVVRLYEILSGKKAEEYNPSPFLDTQDSDVLKAFKLGIVKGTGNNKFSPHNTITRQEICVIILRTIKAVSPELDTYVSSFVSKDGGKLSFTDAYLISDWALEGVSFLSSIDIMKGVGSNKINPLGTTTREQAIVIGKRTLEFFLNILKGLKNNTGNDTSSNETNDNNANNKEDPADKDDPSNTNNSNDSSINDYLKDNNGSGNENGSNNEGKKSVETKTLSISVGNNVIFMGEAEEKVLNKLGEPSRKDLSKYGFEWYIYNKDYNEYIQVGISNGKVVGLYSNATKFKFHDEKSGKSFDASNTKKQIVDCYGEPLKYIQKDNVIFISNEGMNINLYLIDNNYVSFYFDSFNNDKISSVLVIDKETEENLMDFYIKPTPELIESYERQMLDLVNASRVKFGKKPIEWDEVAVKTARKHSKDMADRHFFDHINPDGKDPFERMKDDGINFRAAGENIAAGYAWAIDAHEALMNSSGHRKNILGEYDKFGAGVYFGGDFEIYATTIFFTPWKSDM
ncbi:MAG TPA: hypothetical protein GXX37_05780 [Clostridiaceae bacterium]|nr:hypothetical protein [Clostridiaceae bacterium]